MPVKNETFTYKGWLCELHEQGVFLIDEQNDAIAPRSGRGWTVIVRGARQAREFIDGYLTVSDNTFDYKAWRCEWSEAKQLYRVYRHSGLIGGKALRKLYTEVPTRGQAREFINNY